MFLFCFKGLGEKSALLQLLFFMQIVSADAMTSLSTEVILPCYEGRMNMLLFFL